MNALRPNARRAKRATVFMWLMLAIQLITIVVNFLQIETYKRIMAFEATQEEILLAALLYSGTAIIRAGLFIGAAITFIQWFRRAYFNMHQRHEYLLASEGWAAGGWFVPVLCWIYPVRIMWEMMTETENDLVKEGHIEPKPSRRFLVISWWTLWVTIAVISYLFGFMSINADYGTAMVVTRWGSYLLLLYIPMTIIVVMMIKSYARMEELLPEITKAGPAGFSSGSKDLLDTAF